MNFLKVFTSVAVMSLMLAACGSADKTPKKENQVVLELLTPEQKAVLKNGVEDNVVRDAVDGGIVVKLDPQVQAATKPFGVSPG